MDKLETLKEIMAARRSRYPKDYTGTHISEGELSEILASTENIPNHKKTRPWRFRVFKDEEKMQLARELADLYKKNAGPEQFLEKKYQAMITKPEQSAAIITIVVNFSGLVPEWEEVAATAMAVQNMYLTCTAMDLGCYWSSPKLTEQLGDFLNLEDNQRCIGLFYIGQVN
ncbi:MAG: nitroreductase [Chryseobacterium sp.]|nr:MAG: nitroreductase [Chryseobacterium sp.]